MKLRDLHSQRLRLYIAAAAVATLGEAVLAAVTESGVSLPIGEGALGILIAVIPFTFPGYVEWSYLRWKRSIDDMIPPLLSDITGRVRTGFSLTRSLDLAADSDYGPLTDELKRIRAQLSWGVPFETAVKSFIERVDSLVARRAFGILLEADRAGGKIADMLDAVQKHTAELQQIDSERRAALRPYTITVYLSIFIFLAVAIILLDAFFSQVLANQASLGGPIGAFGGTQSVTLGSVRDAFLQIALVESVVGGLGAGKLGDGSIAAGTRHVIVLLMITLIVFEVFAR